MERNLSDQRVRIRTALNSANAANLSVPVGEYGSGMSPDAPLHVLSFFNRRLAKDFRSTLSRSGIKSSTRRVGRVSFVEVARKDAGLVRAVFEEFRAHSPDVRPSRVLVKSHFACRGIRTGFALWLFWLIATFASVGALELLILLPMICGLFGHLVDRLVARRLANRFYFGFYDCLVAFCLLNMVACVLAGAVLISR
jgi:hypothetical protein